MKQTLIAFKNNPKLKQEILERIVRHRKADELVKGRTGDDGEGCSMWCAFEYYDHLRAEKDTSVPQMVYKLNDVIFENLPHNLSQEWPERFFSSIKVGSDLSMVGPKFLLALIKRVHSKLDKKQIQVNEAILKGLDVLENWVETGTPNKNAASEAAWTASAASAASEAASAASEAASAASEAALAASEAASAASAASEAAWAARTARAAWTASAASAASAASEAAWTASAASEAAWAAWAAEYEWMADILIELIEAAK